MFNPSRQEARRFLTDAWKKYRDKAVLSDLEALAVGHILDHPHYHRLLENADASLERDWRPEAGETNPFLHLMLHLAISEQLSIDQPAGVRARHERLLRRCNDPHAAQHEVMDCLAEMIWRAQRDAAPPDAAGYLDCLRKKAP